MKQSRKADLTTLHNKMAAAARAFHHAAQTLGIEGLIDYANRVQVFVERCKSMLDSGEDFVVQEPQSDVMQRLVAAEAGLAHARQVTEELRAQLMFCAPAVSEEKLTGILAAREREAYIRVQADFEALEIWPALESGHWVVSPDGSLLGAVRQLRTQRHAGAAIIKNMPPRLRLAPKPPDGESK